MTNQVAYSLLTVKSVNDDVREISGMASTPETDRMGDIVDPMGATFAREIPLLWQHRHDQPIGVTQLGKATKAGIPFRATIAKSAEPGPLRDLLDFAWQSIKAGLVRGVSIGFRSIAHEVLDTGGLRFTQYEIYELSAVTIPTNASATIQTIKALHQHADKAGGIRLLSSRDIVPRSATAVLLDRTPRRAAVGLIRSRRVNTPETDGENRYENLPGTGR